MLTNLIVSMYAFAALSGDHPMLLFGPIVFLPLLLLLLALLRSRLLTIDAPDLTPASLPSFLNRENHERGSTQRGPKSR